MSGRGRGSRADTGDYKRELERAERRARRDDLKPRVGTIAFFDLPGSTRVMKDPHAAVPRMILHNSMCAAIIRLNKGIIVKELGDGLVVRFANAGDAVVCGRSIRGLRMPGDCLVCLPRAGDRRGCTAGGGSMRLVRRRLSGRG